MKLTTRFKLNVLYAVVMVILIIGSQYYVNSFVSQFVHRSDRMDHVVQHAFELNLITYDYLLNTSEAKEKSWYKCHQQLSEILQNLIYSDVVGNRLLQKIIHNHGNMKGIFPVIAGRGKRKSEMGKQRELLERFSTQLLVKSQNILRYARQLNYREKERVKLIQKRGNWFIIGIAFLMAFVTILSLVDIIRYVIMPLASLKEAVAIAAEGNFQHKLGIKRDDEIGELSGHFDQMTTTLSQITVRKEQLLGEVEERKKAEELLRSVMENSPDFIVLLMDDDTIKYINRFPAGAIENEILGQTIDRYVPQTERDGFQQFLSQVKETKESVHYQGHFYYPQENDEFFEMVAAPVLHEDKLTGITLILRNVTKRLKAIEEKEKLEKQLRQSQKMEAIGTLAGGIAHDFNNILAGILGYTELTVEKISETDPVYPHLQQVLKASFRARDLVKHILTFSRQAEQQHSAVDIVPIVKEALKLVRASIPATIEIKSEIDPEVGDILADPIQVHQILMNLSTNAYHAIGEKTGVLSVSIQKCSLTSEDLKVRGMVLFPGDYLKMEIADNGCGMSPEVIDKIFDPYFTTKEKGRGTGMGLSVVHGIVKALNGHITVYSELGLGSTFRIYFPLIKNGKNQDMAVPQNPPGGSERILFVDDEEMLTTMAGIILKQLGYRVELINNSQEALNLFLTAPERFDLVITDMAMPKLSGLELSRKILEKRPHLPIILCTGFSESVNAEKAKAVGIKEYLSKPIINQELALVIRRVLDQQETEN